jgi:CO/xanthine dehydrogenase FAD-binding subunit
MKLNVESPRWLVDIDHSPLTQIKITKAGVPIGGLARASRLAADRHGLACLP